MAYRDVKTWLLAATMTPPVPHIWVDNVEQKRCHQCKLYAPVVDFYKLRKSYDGLQQKCKACVKVYSDEHAEHKRAYATQKRLSDTAAARAYDKRRRDNPSDARKASLKVAKMRYDAKAKKKRQEKAAIYKQSPEYIARQAEALRRRRAVKAASQRRRLAQDPLYKLKSLLQGHLGRTLRKRSLQKCFHTMQLCGCTIQKLFVHLTATMPTWGDEPMSFEADRGRYHVDHIIPTSYFNLADPVEQRIAYHWTNLQILTAQDNIRKSNRLPWPKKEVDDYVARRRVEIERHDSFIEDAPQK